MSSGPSATELQDVFFLLIKPAGKPRLICAFQMPRLQQNSRTLCDNGLEFTGVQNYFRWFFQLIHPWYHGHLTWSKGFFFFFEFLKKSVQWGLMNSELVSGSSYLCQYFKMSTLYC